MLLAYLLLFLLLRLPSTACEATTSRNRRLLLLLPAPLTPPATTTLRHDCHATITMHASCSDEYVHAGTMMRRHGSPPPPLPLPPGVKLRGIFEQAMPATTLQEQLGSPQPQPGVKPRGDVEGGNGMAPAEQESAGAMMVAPSPRGDTRYKEGGADNNDVGGEDRGGSSSEVIVTDDDHPETNVDIGIDYAPPKTHPPSHN